MVKACCESGIPYLEKRDKRGIIRGRKWSHKKYSKLKRKTKQRRKERIRGRNKNMVEVNLYTSVQIQRLTGLINNKLTAISRSTSKTWGYRRVDYKRIEKDTP